MKYSYVGKIEAKEGQGKELIKILLDASDLVSKAKGCHLYLVGMEKNNDDVIRVIELWDSKEDHDVSLQNEAIRNLITKAMPLINGPPENGIEIDMLGGKGFNI